MSTKGYSRTFTRTQSWKVSTRVGEALKDTLERLKPAYPEIRVGGEVKRTEYGCKVKVYFKRRRDCNSKCAISLHITDEFHEDFFCYFTHLIEAHCLSLLSKCKPDYQSSDSE